MTVLPTLPLLLSSLVATISVERLAHAQSYRMSVVVRKGFEQGNT